MPQYTVKDKTSGRTITFDWKSQNPPTETDIEDVFQTAGLRDKTTQGAIPTAVAEVGKAISPFTRTAGIERLGIPKSPMLEPSTVTGVGQAAIQPLTFGYGAPILRKGVEALVGKERAPQVLPLPTQRQRAVGMGLGTLGLAKAPILPSVKGGTIANIFKGGALGYAYNPSEIEIRPVASIDRLVQGLGSAALVGVTSLGVKGISALSKYLGAKKYIKDPLILPKKVRGEIQSQKQVLGKNIDNAINQQDIKYPNLRVDLGDEFMEMKFAMADKQTNPGLASDINSIIRKIKNPKVSKLIQSSIDNPQMARNLSSSQVQEIKKAISNSPVIANKLKQGKFANWTQSELEMLDLLSNVRKKQISTYPELQQSFTNYRNYMDAYNQIKNTLKEGSLTRNLQGKGRWQDPEIKQKVNSLLSQKTINQLGGYESATRYLETLQKIKQRFGLWAAIGFGASAIIYDASRRIISGITGD